MWSSDWNYNSRGLYHFVSYRIVFLAGSPPSSFIFTLIHWLWRLVSITLIRSFTDCDTPISLPKLPDELKCHVPDYCTGFDCCLSLDILRTTMNIEFLLDSCAYTLTMSIEKFKKTILLLDYDWGKFPDLFYTAMHNENIFYAFISLYNLCVACNRS